MRPVWPAMILFGLTSACPSAPPTGNELIAAKADLTTRQLIAGLNAKNTAVLRGLIVLTATTGGPPRSLSEKEAAQLVFPEPPFEQLGPGKPGLMLIRDGKQQKRALKLIVVKDELRVLGERLPLSQYSAQESGQAGIAVPGVDPVVISLMARAP